MEDVFVNIQMEQNTFGRNENKMVLLKSRLKPVSGFMDT